MKKIINEKPTLTIFTPTFNRKHTLPWCYESLKRQTCNDFCWLIVDDGSIDGTKELVEQWKNEKNQFDIKYIYKENGGMHTAHNCAYQNIKTELNVCIDSDDYMTDDAVEKIINKWKQEKNNDVAGIIALDVYKNGKVIGSMLPTDKQVISTDEFYENGGTGDKKFIYCTEIINKYPEYPVFKNEKYVSLAYKYRLISQKYKMLIMNEPVCIVEYQEDGSSKNMLQQYVRNPKGFAFIRKINMQYTKSKKRLFMECIHYVSSSIMIKNRKFINESPKKIFTILAIPFGIILNLYIKFNTTR